MADVAYQQTRQDGSPDWRGNGPSFDNSWEEAVDSLRFHRGAGFRIVDKEEHSEGVIRELSEVPERLEAKLTHSPVDDAFAVKSEADGFGIVFRRHELPMTKGEQVLEHARNSIGTRYVLGGTDCSWLTMRCYRLEGVELPHNAHAQHLRDAVVDIPRSKIKPGDLLFHHSDEHVSLYLDDEHGAGRVIDTQPHDTIAPWGGYFGTGVRIRSMNPGYYCEWADISGIGRVATINGEP